MVATKQQLMTVEELEAMPEDGRKRELLWGELISVAPSFRHGKVAGRLISRIGPFAEEGGLGLAFPEGSFMFERDPDLLLIPDVVYVSADRFPPEHEQDGYITTVIPNIAFEVISPSETAQTVHAKVMAYLEMGVDLVVTIDPRQRDVTLWDRHRTARVLSEGDELAFGEVLPGVTVPVGELFR